MQATNKQEIIVSPAESEQKIFQFLQRRLDLPKPLLHRWIRKGKIRCNGLKTKPFARIIEGDIILVPTYTQNIPQPQNLELNEQAEFCPSQNEANLNQNEACINPSEANPSSSLASLNPSAPSLYPSNHLNAHRRYPKSYPDPKNYPGQAHDDTLQIVYEDSDLLVCNKPFGLPTHLGSKHTNSLISIVHRLYGDSIFKPTPVHRLDKDTSGLLLMALSYKTLRKLQEAFKNQVVVKEYLAWIEGRWKHDNTIKLQHKLEKKYTNIYEKVEAGTGKDSICMVRPVFKDATKSLLQIRLITGRTHQIRVQLASEGFPLYGDAKYGSSKKLDFKLHAFRLEVPEFKTFELLPQWKGDFEVTSLPKPILK